MVIVRLCGGLGNQMFQYALGRTIALRRKVPLKFDLTWFTQFGVRNYKLDRLRIVADGEATPEEIAHVEGDDRGGLSRWLFWLVQARLPYYRRAKIEERCTTFDPYVLHAPKNVYLGGYWPCERYFAHIRELLLQEFEPVEPPDPVSREMAQVMEQNESVSLHVRRGDYVTDPQFHRRHGLCPLDYYHQAIARLTSTVRRPEFFVFSDDIPWVREHLVMDWPVTYVTHNGEARDYEDMRLMSRCKHHIIANSTFSWWGAWLCRHPGKMVLAPRRWLNDPTIDTRDRVPDSWQRI
jgi:hypothetical protein